ncbi:anti-sigma factor [Mumia qirimensis]|uniref:anti-sigma factor n=1 Tax=Mumia qirimensis TaxID=3234852 RepID=UPI00351CC445
MNTEHPDLVGLLRGELRNVDVVEADAHLETCAECRDELAAIATGHALLTSTARTLRAPTSVVVPTAPPLAPIPAPWWRRHVGTVVAAALVLVLGAVMVPFLLDGDQSTQVVRQTAALEPVEGTGSGEVVMTEREGAVRMTITTRDLPRPSAGDYYYAWLFEPSTEKMLALGVINPDGEASFEIPNDLVGRYQVVDVSLEQDDGDPGHSVTSVLRADYDGDQSTTAADREDVSTQRKNLLAPLV